MKHTPVHKSTRLINFPVVIKVLGWLMIVEAIFMTLPLATSFIYDESDMLPFLVTTAVTAIIGLILNNHTHPRSNAMRKRESFLLTSSTWVIFSLFGMIPFIVGSPRLTISEAFFEAMSGFTTTGASIITDFSTLSHGLQLWRCLMQWIGGLGIILFTLAVIPMLNTAGGVQLYNTEVTGITHDKLSPRISTTAKQLWGLYLFLTLLLTLLLWFGPMDFFESICHALSTVSTGGFSTKSDSIAAWGSNYITIVITIFMFLGGVNFTLMIKAAMGSYRSLFDNEIFKLYYKVTIAATALIILFIFINDQVVSFGQSTIEALFQVVSTITSTGHTVGNFEAWGPFCMTLVIILMFFGACAGSTSGGAKLDRVLMVHRYVRNEIFRCIHPNIVKGISVSGQILPNETISKVVAFILLYIGIIVIGALALSALGLPFFDSLFSSFSCVGNTGLGSGITGYGGSYDLVPPLGKWILSFLMLTGRLEIYSVIVLFSRSFWKR